MSTRDEVYSREKCEEITTFRSNEEGPKDISVAEKYYDLVTDFYEIGWGKSFHYAPQAKGESFKQAILRHEMALAKALDLKAGMKVLDAGCGVGGPMMNIAKAIGCEITGINICNYQIAKGKKYIEEENLSSLCKIVHGDFMNTAFSDASFDAIYALETTCHAPDKTACFREMFRLLKPGHLFGGYEWCVTPHYDKQNPDHKRVMEVIEHTSQIQKTLTFEEVNQALKDAGFELLDSRDICTEGRSWSLPLYSGFRRKKIVRMCTDFALSLAEKMRRVPEGSCKVAAYLEDAAAAFIEAEKLGIFTPSYHFLARKPV